MKRVPFMNNKLEELRQRYRQASSDEERASIVLEAKVLKGEAGYQCYFVDGNGKQCEKRQEDCWCSPEHKTGWQQVSYNNVLPREVRRLTIVEMREKLKQMAIEAKLKAHTEKNGQRKIEI